MKCYLLMLKIVSASILVLNFFPLLFLVLEQADQLIMKVLECDKHLLH